MPGGKNKRKRSESSSGSASEAEAPAKRKKQKRADVTLTIDGEAYDSTSSTQYGHAEMAALRKYIMDVQKEGLDAGEQLTALAKNKKKVKCLNQPVCPSCGLILKAFGFTKAGATKWGKEQAGGVSWGANMKVQQLMKRVGKGAIYAKALRIGAK